MPKRREQSFTTEDTKDTKETGPELVQPNMEAGAAFKTLDIASRATLRQSSNCATPVLVYFWSGSFCVKAVGFPLCPSCPLWLMLLLESSVAHTANFERGRGAGRYRACHRRVQARHGLRCGGRLQRCGCDESESDCRRARRRHHSHQHDDRRAHQ